MSEPAARTGDTTGRYILCDEIAAGGMATVHVGRLVGVAGFARTVAIKRLHRHLAKDEELVTMLLDEARIVARIRHPNVVAILDVAPLDNELLLVMEYIHGDSLAGLLRSAAKGDERMPIGVAAAIMVDVLNGLHAAHEARDERGAPLNIVHRDVSPQNILVGADGVARVLDFGIAKAHGRVHNTVSGQIKGKLTYIAPEQFTRKPVTRQADVYSAAIVFWQAVTGRQLFEGGHDAAIVEQILFGVPRSARDLEPAVSPELDAILARGLSREPAARFETAKEMSLAIERATSLASGSEVAAWVEAHAAEALERRARMVERTEAGLPESVMLSIASKEEVGLEADTDRALREPTPPTGVLAGVAPPATYVAGSAPDETVAPSPAAPAAARSASRRALVVVIAVVAATAGFVTVALRDPPVRAAPLATESIPSPPAPRTEPTVPVDSVPIATAELPAQPAPSTGSSNAASTAGRSAVSASARTPSKGAPRHPPRPARPALPKGLPGERN